MSRIPCRKCPECGLYHDFTVAVCECGKELTYIGPQMVQTQTLSAAQYGEINTSVKVYVQKCPVCGALSYTDGPDNRVKKCFNCTKIRIAKVDPVAYQEEDSGESEESVMKSADALLRDDGNPAGNSSRNVAADDDDDDDDDDTALFWQGLYGNVQKTAGNAQKVPAGQQERKDHRQPESKPEAVQNYAVDDEDDDDDDVIGWGGILGTNTSQTPVKPPVRRDITLTAVNYGRLTFAVGPDQGNYMLGRDANQSVFLSQDRRVSNNHCYLFYRDGGWYVRDNHSSNGTAVNSKDIGLNGESILKDGDELKLGHHSDSVVFRVSIR